MVNYLNEVAKARDRYPEAWRNAHTNGPGTEDFIRLLAADLHKIDPNVGLNGKRGNRDDISDDALAVLDPEGDVNDPQFGRMFVIDCITSAGAPDAAPAWGSVGSGGHPGGWVKPAGAVPITPAKPLCPDPSVHGKPICPLPAAHTKPLCPNPLAHVPKAYPRDESVWDSVMGAIQDDMQAAGQQLNAGSGRWAARTIWRVVNEDMSLEDSIAKTKRELREVLGIV